MRLRNIPGADDFISAHPDVINIPKENKGNWKKVFSREGEVVLEIGMGKGQFILSTAKRNPEKNYIGIELYSSVLLRGIERYETEEFSDLENIKFLCINAMELPEVFEKREVEKIYLNFSDPWPKARHAKRRLTSREFLKRYEEILKPEGTVEFKTDNRGLFDFSVEELKAMGWTIHEITYDLHHDETMNQGNIMTEYEEKFSGMGNPIHKWVASYSHE